MRNITKHMLLALLVVVALTLAACDTATTGPTPTLPDPTPEYALYTAFGPSTLYVGANANAGYEVELILEAIDPANEETIFTLQVLGPDGTQIGNDHAITLPEGDTRAHRSFNNSSLSDPLQAGTYTITLSSANNEITRNQHTVLAPGTGLPLPPFTATHDDTAITLHFPGLQAEDANVSILNASDDSATNTRTATTDGLITVPIGHLSINPDDSYTLLARIAQHRFDTKNPSNLNTRYLWLSWPNLDLQEDTPEPAGSG